MRCRRMFQRATLGARRHHEMGLRGAEEAAAGEVVGVVGGGDVLGGGVDVAEVALERARFKERRAAAEAVRGAGHLGGDFGDVGGREPYGGPFGLREGAAFGDGGPH